MINVVAVVLITACLGAQAPLDGLDRAAIISEARTTARMWRESPNAQRRQEVARVVVAKHLIVGRDRQWLRDVLEWSCKQYDVVPATPTPVAPVAVVPVAQPLYYYVPQAYYYQPLIRGSCATGTCPR